MAAIQNKHSVPGAQGRSRRAHASTKPAVKTRKPRSLLKPIITRHGKTTFLRYRGRSFHRFEEIRGKPVDFIEFYTSGEYHAIDVRFQDKTALHFIIEPRFTVEADFSDWKTGNLRRIRKWPPIPSAGLNA